MNNRINDETETPVLNQKTDSPVKARKSEIPVTGLWDEIRNGLAVSRKAIEKAFEPDREETDRILKARARDLAQEKVKTGERESHVDVVDFMLAHEKYALELAHIREVYALKELTPIPFTPPFVLGIMNIRGQILSVIDLKKFFDLPDNGMNDLKKVIILANDDMEFGILADAILGVRSMPLKDIQPSLPTLKGIKAEYLKGLTGDRVVILDAQRILNDKNIVVHQEI